MLRHLINTILFVLPPSRLFRFRRFLLSLAGVTLGNNVKYCGRAWIYGRGRLVIGENTWLSPATNIYTHTSAAIKIGSNCDIGPDVMFHPGSHEIGPCERRAGVGNASPVIIEDGCWIGGRTLILGGVTVGTGAIVAAGSVVVSDVPPHTLVAGVPAKIKRHLSK